VSEHTLISRRTWALAIKGLRSTDPRAQDSAELALLAIGLPGWLDDTDEPLPPTPLPRHKGRTDQDWDPADAGRLADVLRLEQR
jgi:hypothetical protein